jgi:serine protease
MATRKPTSTATSKRASKRTSKPRQQGDTYRVSGVIINLGEALLPAKRKAILETLNKEVPELTALVGPNPQIELMGKGSTDVLVRVAQGRSPSVQDAWSAVHALQRHSLVTDAEPAVRIAAEQPEAPRKGIAKKSVGATRHLPGSDNPLWSVQATRVDAVWQSLKVTGKGVRVGHPDTGYTQHQEILGPRLRITDGYDFEGNKANPLDPMSGQHPGHGTATASVIFSGTKSNPRVAGVAPEAELVPLRVSDSVMHFDFSNLTQALYRARDRGCQIVSMSLGGPWAGRSLSRAVDQVVNDGLILLAAAGNVWPWVVYPAKFDNVIAVAACNVATKPWAKSASGPAVDVTAPGESVWRAYSKKNASAIAYSVERSSGTSYAVATTAGVCALWLQHHGVVALQKKYGARLASVFLQLVRDHSRPVSGWDKKNYGPGVLDAQRLLAAPLPAIGPAPVRVAKSVSKKSASSSATWARLQPYVPELSSTELAIAASSLFGESRTMRKATTTTKATRRPPSLVDEIEFHVATNPAIRAALVANASAKPTNPLRRMATKHAGKAAVRKAAPGWRVLTQVASPELQAMLTRAER